MSLSERAGAASAAAAAAAFVAACIAARAWVLLPVPSAAAAAWLLSRRPRGRFLAGVSLAILVCGSGAGFLAGLPPLLLLATILAGISAWDMRQLALTSRDAADPAAVRRVEKAHLGRLLLILGAGALLGAAALLLRHSLGFPAVLCAAILFALSFGTFLRSLGKGGT
jgi:hypothetical protein